MDKDLKYIISNTNDSENYWHWTFETIPKLIVLKDLIDKKGWVVKLINQGSSLKEFQMQWLATIFGDKVTVKSVDSQGILVNNLISIREPFPAHHSKWMIEKIKAYGDKMKLLGLDNTAKRLYIKRGKTRNGRNVENEKEIIKYLTGKGYCILEMDCLSVNEQIRYFENASEIIGPHGAAFTNMVYCKPHTNIIELYHPDYLPGQNMALAQLCRLNLTTLIGEKVTSRNGGLAYIMPINIIEKNLARIHNPEKRINTIS